MKYDDLTIVLPTYNEEGNIGRIITKLMKLYGGVSIIVMDDGSRDSTGKVVMEFSRKTRNVVFVNRAGTGAEKGLTASAVDGILKAKTKYVVVMDADLQHPPEVIAKIVAGLRTGCRLVVAGRASVEGWEFHRKLISKSLIILGHVSLILRNGETCKDIFSGYFGMERASASAIIKRNRQRFVGSGYKVLFDILKCIPRGSEKVCDVPYAFNMRNSGESKAGSKQVIALLKSFIS